VFSGHPPDDDQTTDDEHPDPPHRMLHEKNPTVDTIGRDTS
jgi:hypothetical protein